MSCSFTNVGDKYIMTENKPNDFDLFNGGPLQSTKPTKSGDMAIAYNIAVSNIEKMLQYHENTGKEIELSDFPLSVDEDLKDESYRMLKEYLWKGHTERKNPDEVGLKAGEKEQIINLLVKLNAIRNYHSHIWHNNAVLSFECNLKKNVEEKYEIALAKAGTKYPSEVKEFKRYHPLFNENHITVEGRIFFLSFFLTSGQMSRLLQQRPGSKRNDMPLFKIKHIVYKHFCHRDGASIMGFHQEESILSDMKDNERQDILKARTAYKLLTYLNDYPDYLADNERLPLFLPAPEAKEKIKKINTVQELHQFIKAKKLLVDFTFTDVKGN